MLKASRRVIDQTLGWLNAWRAFLASPPPLAKISLSSSL
jgi:hypothetical protein